jgi:hypothetical protein
MKNKDQGFIVPVLLGIIALLLVGGGFYYYHNKILVSDSSQSISNETSGTPTIFVDTRPSSSPSPFKDLSLSKVSLSADYTQYPISLTLNNIKVNITKAAPTLVDGATNLLEWNAPWATSCVLNGNAGQQGFLSNKGMQKFIVAYEGPDYPKNLQFACTVGSHSTSINIDLSLAPSSKPDIAFTFPTTGTVITRTIVSSGQMQKVVPEAVTIHWVPAVKSISLSLHDSATGNLIDRFDVSLPVRFSNNNGDSTSWSIAAVKDGTYYIRVDAVNFSPTNLKTADFVVKTK